MGAALSAIERRCFLKKFLKKVMDNFISHSSTTTAIKQRTSNSEDNDIDDQRKDGDGVKRRKSVQMPSAVMLRRISIGAKKERENERSLISSIKATHRSVSAGANAIFYHGINPTCFLICMVIVVVAFMGYNLVMNDKIRLSSFHGGNCDSWLPRRLSAWLGDCP